MRMQNTDMEFVTFDAQDVIATSYPAGIPMAAQFGAIVYYNRNNGGGFSGNTNNQISNDDGVSLYQSEPKDKGYDMGGFVGDSNKDKWTVFNVDTSSGPVAVRTKDTKGGAMPEGSYYYVYNTDEDSFAKIQKWLFENGGIQ